MSHSMDTTAGQVGNIAPPSNSRWWAIAAGIGVAAILGYGAALIATEHLPGTEHSVAAPVAAVATPQVQSFAGSDDLATRSATQAVPQAQAAVGAGGGLSPQAIAELRGEAMVEYFASQAVVGPVLSSGVVSEYLGVSRVLSPQAIAELRGEAMVEYFAAQSLRSAVSSVDPFEAQLVPLEVLAAVGVGDLATQSIVSTQSFAGADDLATRFVVSEAIRYAGADDLATRFVASEAIRYAGVGDLATRSAAGVGGAVAQSALDPFETRATSSGAVELDAQPTVLYFNGQWHME